MIFVRWSWLIVLAGAVVALVSIDRIHTLRAEYISGLPEWSAAAPRIDPASPTGYEKGKRRLIVPGHDNASYQWIAQTQQMVAEGEWRIRRVDYENAPAGRPVHSASPYRWWLGLVAWLNHVYTSHPLGIAVERAALFADPLLHLLLVVGTTVFAAWRFGPLTAAALSLALVGLFPFSASFLSGAPESHSLAQTCALWSILLLLAGSVDLLNINGDSSDRLSRARRWFFMAGAAGGGGLWVGPPDQIPIIIGIALGAVTAAGLVGRSRSTGSISPAPPPWRSWALGGAVASIIGYLLEYCPAKVGFPRIEVIHPLFGLAWLGGGELLARVVNRLHRGPTPRRWRDLGSGFIATLAVAALPIAIVLGNINRRAEGDPLRGVLNLVSLKTSFTSFIPKNDPLASQLTNHGEIAAETVAAWIARDGFTTAAVATLLPSLLIIIGIGLIARSSTGMDRRMILIVALGPTLIALALAWTRLRYWNFLDTALLALLAAGTAKLSATPSSWRATWGWGGLVALLVIPGMRQLSTAAANDATTPKLTRLDMISYLERDLAHWLADRTEQPGEVVLAAPSLTTTLCFHGGFKGISTLNWENTDGLLAAVRMVSATTPEEAQTLLNGRGVRYIVLTTWDPALDEYSRLNLGTSGQAARLNTPFITALNDWDIPLWIQPIPYALPENGGLEESVKIFRVVDEQDTAVAASRLADYFIAMRQVKLATAMIEPLRGFPRDVSALVALAQIEVARGDTEAVKTIVATLLPILSRGADRNLLWDRRVALAIILAQGKQMDDSRVQVSRCVEQMTENKLRALSSSSLFQLQQLCGHFGIPIADPKLRELARILSGPETKG